MLFLHFSSRIRLNFRYLYEVFAFKSLFRYSETDFSEFLCAKSTMNVSCSKVNGDQLLVNYPFESRRYIPGKLLLNIMSSVRYLSRENLVYECNNKLLRKCKISPLGAKMLVYDRINKLLWRREIIPLVGAITEQSNTERQQKVSIECLHCLLTTELPYQLCRDPYYVTLNYVDLHNL